MNFEEGSLISVAVLNDVNNKSQQSIKVKATPVTLEGSFNIFYFCFKYTPENNKVKQISLAQNVTSCWGECKTVLSASLFNST